MRGQGIGIREPKAGDQVGTKMENAQQTTPAHASREIEAFEYRACAGDPPTPEWSGWIEAEDSTAAAAPQEQRKGARKSTANPASGERLAEDTSFEAGRERGRTEGRQAERDAQAAHAAEEEKRRRQQLTQLVTRIAQERDRFFEGAEKEVVKLALAIAARILRREAQMDPLLLTGAVRVALGQMAGASEVRLLVPAAEADLWAETVALLPNLTPKPVVVAAQEMHVGDCTIESKVGTVDLGVRSQLGEIERGFFDRPADSVPAATEPRAPAEAPAPDEAVDAELA